MSKIVETQQPTLNEITGTFGQNALLTVDEACRFLRMNFKNARKCLMRRVREGKLKAGRNGKTYLFSKDHLMAYVFKNGRVS